MPDSILSRPLAELRQDLQQQPESLIGVIPGVFLLDKPQGVTSHDMVMKMRRELGIKKVGHGGTLDPLATGLLLILAGNATRLFNELQLFRKTYICRLRLGTRTDTFDICGKVQGCCEVPKINSEQLEVFLSNFRGRIKQIPPMFSALKKNGVPLYKLARCGIEVAREPREVEVYDLSGRIMARDTIELSMTVASGFYVRSLVDELGTLFGCGAVMTELRRTCIGPFAL